MWIAVKIVYLSKFYVMANKVTPYNNTSKTKKEQVEEMFDNISNSYDGLNRVISFGIDIKWRKKVVQLVNQTRPNTILDVATGTGDLAIQLTKSGAKEIIGVDISNGMLGIGKEKVNSKNLQNIVKMVQGDSENLDFEDHYFDAVTVAFGVRNFDHLDKGLSELYRVLKPGGILVILETSLPTKTPYKQGHKFYCETILPLIGRLFSRDKSAYSYLSKSAASFPFGLAFNNILKKNGFIDVEDEPQTFGVATIYTATK